jgi:hypothetical protein
MSVKLGSKNVMLNLEVGYELGSLEGTALYHVFIYLNKENEIVWDMDYVDDTDVKYMGMEVEERGKIWEFHRQMGINLNPNIETLCEPKIDEYLKENISQFEYLKN